MIKEIFLSQQATVGMLIALWVREGGIMSMYQQKTLKRDITIEGIGLHSGAKARVRLNPSAPNSGIIFVRADLENAPLIPGVVDSVVHTKLATTLGDAKDSKSPTISTVEHLLSALQGFAIDNALIEVFGPEIPIMDGSAAPFCRAILDAGIQYQEAPRKVLRIKRRVEVKVAEKWAVAQPSAGFEIQASIDWDHPSIGFQEFHYTDGITDFATIAGARTFGFARDVEALKKMGLARGGSLDNAVVLDDHLILNPDGLRYPDEFVRHKVLDALGDFKLAGFALQGCFKLHRSGHDLHRELLKAILADPRNYEITKEHAFTESRPASLAKFRTNSSSILGNGKAAALAS